MSDVTGDGQDQPAAGPQVIRLGAVTGSTPASGAPVSAGPPTEHDLFAPSRLRLTRRRAIAGGLLAVLVVGGWAGYVRGTHWWDEREAARQMAAYDAAVTDAGTRLDDYRLPAAITTDEDASSCWLSPMHCGTTTLSPQQAAAVVSESLEARGFTVTAGAREQCVPSTSRFERCVRDISYGGQDIGTLQAERDNYLATWFGALTSVTLFLSPPSNGGPVDYLGPPRDIAVPEPSTLTVLPADLARLARCAKRSADGCLAYRVTGTFAGEPGAAWSRTGRFAVAHDWRATGGCAAGPTGTCTFGAVRRTGTAVRQTFSVEGTFAPEGERTRVDLEVTATRTATA